MASRCQIDREQNGFCDVLHDVLHAHHTAGFPIDFIGEIGFFPFRDIPYGAPMISIAYVPIINSVEYSPNKRGDAWADVGDRIYAPVALVAANA
jgi:hypothetical protein